MELSFSMADISYTANYVGDRPEKPGRWWYCAELEIYVELPVNANEADVVAAFETFAAAQQEVF